MSSQSAPQAIHIPVLIVGAGPVGLALAGDLGWRGVPCLVVERNKGTADHPRATAENARTMEFFRRWGIADAVRDAGVPPDSPHAVLYATGMQGYEIARIDRPSHGGRGPSTTSPERPQRCNQLWLDPILQEFATSFQCVQIRYGCRFDTLVDNRDKVVAVVEDLASGTRQTVIADYLVDCSGSRSRIRDSLGIEMEGDPHTDYHLSVFVRMPELWQRTKMDVASMIFFVEPEGVWRNLIGLDGKELWRFTVSGKEYYDNPDKVDLDTHFDAVVGKNVPREFVSVKRWQARDVVAQKYRAGRIFLVGDAAHINHPTGGFGLNTGIGDVADIGWKLAAMVQGWGGPGLLDSYEFERRPVGIRNVTQASTTHWDDRERKGPEILTQSGGAGDRARAEMREAILRSQTKKVLTDGTALGYRYEGSPIVLGDGTEAPPDTITEYSPTSRAGARAPHAFLVDGRSVLDLFGRGFTLLRFDQNADTGQLEQGLAARGVPFSVESIDNPQIAALYERALVLVRPDGHVAWRGDAPPGDATALADRVRGA